MCNIDAEGELWVEHGDVRLAVHRSRYESLRTYLASPDMSWTCKEKELARRETGPPNILTVQPLSLQFSKLSPEQYLPRRNLHLPESEPPFTATSSTS